MMKEGSEYIVDAEGFRFVNSEGTLDDLVNVMQQKSTSQTQYG